LGAGKGIDCQGLAVDIREAIAPVGSSAARNGVDRARRPLTKRFHGSGLLMSAQ